MEIDLRDVPFYWLNPDHRRDRREHMQQQLTGFRHERVDGTPSPFLVDSKRRQLVLAPLGHARVIEHAVNRMPPGRFEPFVLCEDDIAWRRAPAAGPVIVNAPDYADAVYLGISACACRADAADYCWHMIRKRSEAFPHLQRVYNMLTAHAVLFLSFRHAMAYAQAMVESCAAEIPCDTLSCRLFAKHEVFAFGEPLFYQAEVVGGQERPTNITWTDAGAGFDLADGLAARTWSKVHPYSTLLAPLERTTTVAMWVDKDEDVERLPSNEQLVVCWDRATFDQARYERVQRRFFHAWMLWPRRRDTLITDLCRVNPHNSYEFVVYTRALPAGIEHVVRANLDELLASR